MSWYMQILKNISASKRHKKANKLKEMYKNMEHGYNSEYWKK